MQNPILKTTAGLALLSVMCVPIPATSADADVLSIPPALLDWQSTQEGVAFATIIGNRFEEPYMAMVRLPAGLISPAHAKSANMFGVVVEGTMTHYAVSDGTGTALPQGSFYKIPKDLPHISECISKVDCVTFLYQDGKFDFLPVTN
ncbi:MAG: DUF4437 domain-containing protein [Alphaproteobacteria bacterium]|nr:DUF4437 domain-containing protein [Alphaproteobacteria bacterium]